MLLVRDDREFLCAPGEELHTDLGVVDVPEDVEAGETLETHLGEEFRTRALRGPDLFNHFERTGAPMMTKDIGLIEGHTGACASDRVLDAGTGTGVLAAYLGRLGADVTTYEQDSEFADVARGNMELAEVSENVEVRTGNVLDDIDDLTEAEGEGLGDATAGESEGFDLVTLDTGDAPAVVEHAPDLLVSGGYLAVYSPFVENTREVHRTARDVGLSDVDTYESIQRRMDFDDRGSRPSTAGVGHTGYLTFARKL
nr:methyltransferase [Halocalculus aciditolerans]